MAKLNTDKIAQGRRSATTKRVQIVMNRFGDTRHEFDVTDAAAVALAEERFRELIYVEAASGAEHDSDFPYPREYLGVYLERRRESGFQLYNTLGIARGDKAAYAQQALENYNFFGAPHVAIIHSDEPLGLYGAEDTGIKIEQVN